MQHKILWPLRMVLRRQWCVCQCDEREWLAAVLISIAVLWSPPFPLMLYLSLLLLAKITCVWYILRDYRLLVLCCNVANKQTYTLCEKQWEARASSSNTLSHFSSIAACCLHGQLQAVIMNINVNATIYVKQKSCSFSTIVPTVNSNISIESSHFAKQYSCKQFGRLVFKINLNLSLFHVPPRFCDYITVECTICLQNSLLCFKI